MNIARFTFSLALLSSAVAPALAHKDGCSHGCKHESLHPTKKSTSSHSEKEADKTDNVEVAKNIEIAEPTIAAKLAEPVTVTTVSESTHVIAPATITPAEEAPAVQVAKAAEIENEAISETEVVTLTEMQENVEEVVLAQVSEITEATITIASADTPSQNLSEEEKEKRRKFADLRPEDINATIEEIAKLLEDEELILSSIDDAVLQTDVQTAAAPAPEDINNLTQVMI